MAQDIQQLLLSALKNLEEVLNLEGLTEEDLNNYLLLKPGDYASTILPNTYLADPALDAKFADFIEMALFRYCDIYKKIQGLDEETKKEYLNRYSLWMKRELYNIRDHHIKSINGINHSYEADGESSDTEKSKPAIKELKIHVPPRHVETEDIGENGKLLSNNQIQKVKDWFAANPDKLSTRILKKDKTEILKKDKTEKAYRVVKKDGHYFAVYEGKKKQTETGKRKLLGEGGFGKVKLAQNLETGEWLALKLPKEKKQRGEFETEKLEFETENQVAQSLGSTAYLLKESAAANLKKEHFFMPLVSGTDLYSLSQDKSLELPPGKWLELGLNATKSIAALHAAGVLHCDIKTDNIIGDFITGQAMAIDYGCSLVVNPETLIGFAPLRGTLLFLAPEIKSARRNEIHKYNEKSEVFALGVTLAELYGLLDNNEANSNKVVLLDKDNDGLEQQSRISYKPLRDETIDFVQRMIDINPDKRPSVNECAHFLEHAQDFCFLSTPEIKRTGLFDIDAYYKSGKIAQRNMLNALKCCNEVWLVDTKGQYQDQYVSIIRQLQDRKILVTNKVFQPEVEGQSLSITDIPKTQTDMMRRYYCPSRSAISNTDEICRLPIPSSKVVGINSYKDFIQKDLSQLQITPEQKSAVSRILSEDIERLSAKHGQSPDRHIRENLMMREDKINKFIADLGKSHNFTLADLSKELKKLERELVGTNRLTNFFSKFLPITASDSQKLIKNVVQYIEKDLSGPKPRP